MRYKGWIYKIKKYSLNMTIIPVKKLILRSELDD